MVGDGGQAAHVLVQTTSTPPTRRPAARKLLLDGVGVGIVEREATNSRWPRLGDSLRSSRVKRGTEMLLLLVD